MIFLGLILRTSGLIYLGALFYGVMVLFTVITLPVEIDASRRALVLLRESNLIHDERDAAGARQAFSTAAAMTYVAAAVTAILTLLYYLTLANRRR